MAKHKQWHVTGWRVFLLAPVAIPIILLIKLGEVFGLKISADLTPEDVVSYVQDFLNGGGGEWDWDDFTSIRITDPMLDDIRAEAAQIELPLTDESEVELSQLLERARAIAAASVETRPA